MMLERIQWRIGRRQNLDMELLVESSWEKLRRPESFRDRVEVNVRRRLCQRLTQTENFFECLVQPDAGGGAPKKMIVLGKDPPHPARIPLLAIPDLQIL